MCLKVHFVKYRPIGCKPYCSAPLRSCEIALFPTRPRSITLVGTAGGMQTSSEECGRQDRPFMPDDALMHDSTVCRCHDGSCAKRSGPTPNGKCPATDR